MLQEERYYKIIAFVQEKQQARFSELAEHLNVSEGTVRKDLAELEKRDIVRLVRGGVIWGKSDLARGKQKTRQIINKDQKEQLVRKLDCMVENGCAISMNGGTTAIEAAKYIVQNYNKMTIITNSLEVADILRSREAFDVIVAGGVYDRNENTIVGDQASVSMSAYNTDLAIISVSGISLEKGITDFRHEEIKVINTMIANSKRRAVVADHSKFDKIDCMNVCSLENIDIIITDTDIAPEIIERYGRNGVKIIA